MVLESLLWDKGIELQNNIWKPINMQRKFPPPTHLSEELYS